MKMIRVVLPLFGNALLMTYAGSTKATTRVKFLAFSLLAAVFMLDGQKLGLPSNYGGVPFVISLVIIHITIASIVLIISLYECEKHFRLIKKVMLVGQWDALTAARARWEHAEALITKHRGRAFHEAGIVPDVSYWPTMLGSTKDPPVFVHQEQQEASAESGIRQRKATTEEEMTEQKRPVTGEAWLEKTPEAHAITRLDEIASMLAVLPDLMARASKEPVAPFEPNAYFKDWLHSEAIEKYLRCSIVPAYLLTWMISAIVYWTGTEEWS